MWIPRDCRALPENTIEATKLGPRAGSGPGDVFMLGSLVLETVIGLVFVYLIFSLIASALAEYLSALLDRRSEHLKHLLLNLFDNDDPRGRTMLNLFVSHPMVQALCATQWKPSFLTAVARREEGVKDLDRARGKWDSAARSAAAAASARAEART